MDFGVLGMIWDALFKPETWSAVIAILGAIYGAWKARKAQLSESKAKEKAQELSGTVETVDSLQRQVRNNEREINVLQAINTQQNMAFQQLNTLHDQLEQEHERMATQISRMQLNEQENHRKINELTARYNDMQQRYLEAVRQNEMLVERIQGYLNQLESAGIKPAPHLPKPKPPKDAAIESEGEK